MVNAKKPEWIFLQRVTWDTRNAFAVVEKMIQETFFPHPYFRKTKTLSPIIGVLSTMPVKKYGLGLLDPVMSDQEKYLIFTWGITELVRDVPGGEKFSNANHLQTLSE